MEQSTTKKCPKCGNTRLVHISTQNQKRCTDCGTVIKWHKDKGQENYV